MAERYAVLISSSAAPFYPEFFFDVVLMREALIGNGFPANNIFVLYGNGADYNDLNYPAARYRPAPAITDMSATMANVQQIFSDLANGTNGRPQLTDQDLLFVYTFDHGGDTDPLTGDAISTLCLGDGNMRADDFATAVDQVDYAHRIFCMQQCHSGGFISHLENDHTVILTAAQATHTSHPTDDTAEEEWIGGTEYTHAEFTFYLLSALNGQDLLGNYANADADRNGCTSMREIFDFIIAKESDSATPQYADGTQGLGDRLHLSFSYLYIEVSDFVIKSPNVHTNYKNVIHLKGDCGLAFLYFVPEGKVLGTNRIRMNQNICDVYYPMSSWAQCVDLLRNEKPVYFFYDDSNKTAVIKTSDEPIGEEES